MIVTKYLTTFLSIASAITFTSQAQEQLNVHEPSIYAQETQMKNANPADIYTLEGRFYDDDFSLHKDRMEITFPAKFKAISEDGAGIVATDEEGMTLDIKVDGIDKGFNPKRFSEYFGWLIQSKSNNYRILYNKGNPIEVDLAFLSMGWINEQNGSFTALALFKGSRHIFYVSVTTPNTTDMEYNMAKANAFFNTVKISTSIEPNLSREGIGN
jgi:hypothetical protein